VTQSTIAPRSIGFRLRYHSARPVTMPRRNQRKDQLFGDAEYVGDDSYRPAQADNPQFSEGVRQTRLHQLYFISR
jgi:hypothetical protein